MVLGLYYLSLEKGENAKDETIPTFGTVAEAMLALDRGYSLHTPVRIRLQDKALPEDLRPEGWDPDSGILFLSIGGDQAAASSSTRCSRPTSSTATSRC